MLEQIDGVARADHLEAIRGRDEVLERRLVATLLKHAQQAHRCLANRLGREGAVHTQCGLVECVGEHEEQLVALVTLVCLDLHPGSTHGVAGRLFVLDIHLHGTREHLACPDHGVELHGQAVRDRDLPTLLRRLFGGGVRNGSGGTVGHGISPCFRSRNGSDRSVIEVTRSGVTSEAHRSGSSLGPAPMSV